jgi:hypothetical protein
MLLTLSILVKNFVLNLKIARVLLLSKMVLAVNCTNKVFVLQVLLIQQLIFGLNQISKNSQGSLQEFVLTELTFMKMPRKSISVKRLQLRQHVLILVYTMLFQHLILIKHVVAQLQLVSLVELHVEIQPYLLIP